MQRTHPACGPQAFCLRIFLDYQTVAGKDAREPHARMRALLRLAALVLSADLVE